MKTEEVVIRVGGAAGDGVQSAGLIIAKTFSRSGLHVNTYNYYQRRTKLVPGKGQ